MWIDLVNSKYGETAQKLTDLLIQRKKLELEDLRSSMLLAQDKASTSENTRFFGSDTWGHISGQMTSGAGIKDFSNNVDDYIKTLDTETQIVKLKEWQVALNDAKVAGEDVGDAISWVQTRLNYLTTAQDEATTATDNYNNALAEISLYDNFGIQTVETKEEFDNLIDTINNSDIQIGNLGLDESKSLLIDIVQNYFPEFIEAVEVSEDIVYDLSEATEALNENIDSLQSAYSTLTAAQNEYNTTGELSMDTAQSLLAMGGEYLQYLTFADDKIRLNTEAIDAKIESMKEEMIASTQAALAEEIRGIVEDDLKTKTDDLTTSTDTARQKLIDIGTQAINTAEDMTTLAGTVAAVNAAFYGDIDASGLSEDAMNTIENAQTRITTIGSLGVGKTSLGGSSSSGSGYNEEKRLLEQEYKYRIITAQDYYDSLEKLRKEHYGDGSREDKIIEMENQEAYYDAVQSEIADKIKVIELL